MHVVICSRCGGYIESNQLRYLVGVHVTLDLDGSGNPTEAIRRADTARIQDESLADRFVLEKAFTLCVPCRDRFVENPVGSITGPLLPDRGFVQ